MSTTLIFFCCIMYTTIAKSKNIHIRILAIIPIGKNNCVINTITNGTKINVGYKNLELSVSGVVVPFNFSFSNFSFLIAVGDVPSCIAIPLFNKSLKTIG
ncbi:hypothetical protein MrNuV_ORF066 [Macrobrachium rosenbergii nudivirus]|nr:hypothetical protein MrNuV_ORF066 [Macrobrachium rosenbergii nudivirus]